LGESDEKAFRPADVAEPIRVFILDYFAYQLRAALAELFKAMLNVIAAPIHEKLKRISAVIRAVGSIASSIGF